VPGLGTSFGRGGATTTQWDLVNSDCILIQGSNMAEAHPIAFRFVMQAKARGATIIHIDPRFTRTSALADHHLALRPGSDVALLGGLINEILGRDLWFRDYVLSYTNADHIIAADYQDADDVEGLFAGFDPDSESYATAAWRYDRAADTQPAIGDATEPEAADSGPPSHPRRDPSLAHPRCVLNILRRHFARYTPAMVEATCGVPANQLRLVADALARNSGPDRTSALCYAVGWTQHTTGVQVIRAAAILQLLLGNIGRPGGGILALRGHATIQGSTDIPTLYNLLPGYLPMPADRPAHRTLADYVAAEAQPAGAWTDLPAYLVSLLKSWYGDAATAANDFAFGHLPRITGDHSQEPMMLAMADGAMRGFFLLGQNPAVGGHNTAIVRRGLANLDWLVVRDPYENETAAFWYAAPEVSAGTLRPDQIKTEVFLLPAALTAEKDGSYTNTHRLVQYHDRAVLPPGDVRSDAWFIVQLGRRLKALATAEPRDTPLRDLTWDYPTEGRHDEPDLAYVLREINGYQWASTWAERQQVADFSALRADGSTACGCWIYSGIMPDPGRNRARDRTADGPDGPGTHLGWGFAWPVNRRILYNRAAARPDGTPWSARKQLVWWEAAAGRWVGHDTPDFPLTKPPDYQPGPGARGLDAHSGQDPFVMLTEGKGRLFVPVGLRDGPLPVHYEPVESPMRNPLHRQQANPVARLFRRPDNPLHAAADPDYPHIATTYRLTEHHTGGTMSRYVPWLAELQPALFAEIDPVLANELGLTTGDWATVGTARGRIETQVLVTPRLRPLHVSGRVVHQVGLPWHYGERGIAVGASANLLSAIVGDPNTTIHEGKAFTCNLRPGRVWQNSSTVPADASD
jgi:formate dehydrogenase major subunit